MQGMLEAFEGAAIVVGVPDGTVVVVLGPADEGDDAALHGGRPRSAGVGKSPMFAAPGAGPTSSLTAWTATPALTTTSS